MLLSNECIHDNGFMSKKVITSKLTGTASEEDAASWEEKLTNSGNTTAARTMTTGDMAGV